MQVGIPMVIAAGPGAVPVLATSPEVRTGLHRRSDACISVRGTDRRVVETLAGLSAQSGGGGNQETALIGRRRWLAPSRRGSDPVGVLALARSLGRVRRLARLR